MTTKPAEPTKAIENNAGLASFTPHDTDADNLRSLLEIYSTLSPGRYQWGVFDEADATAKIVENFSHGSGRCHVIGLVDHPRTVVGDDPAKPEHMVTMAVTGNGPKSEDNARGLVTLLTALSVLAARKGGVA